MKLCLFGDKQADLPMELSSQAASCWRDIRSTTVDVTRKGSISDESPAEHTLTRRVPILRTVFLAETGF